MRFKKREWLIWGSHSCSGQRQDGLEVEGADIFHHSLHSMVEAYLHSRNNKSNRWSAVFPIHLSLPSAASFSLFGFSSTILFFVFLLCLHIIRFFRNVGVFDYLLHCYLHRTLWMNHPFCSSFWMVCLLLPIWMYSLCFKGFVHQFRLPLSVNPVERKWGWPLWTIMEGDYLLRLTGYRNVTF